MTTEYILLLSAFVLAVAIGNFSLGAFLARLRGVDLAQQGSGGTGFTNAQRVLGTPLASLVLLLDISKAALCVLAFRLLSPTSPPEYAVFVGFGVIFGNAFLKLLTSPAVRRSGGKGLGKGVASTLGVICVVDLRVALIALAIFALGFLISIKRVSVGSLAASLALPFLLDRAGHPEAVVTIAWCMALIIWYRHTENIYRLFWGIERQVGAKRAKPSVPLAGFVVHATGSTSEDQWQQVKRAKPKLTRILGRRLTLLLLPFFPIWKLRTGYSVGIQVKAPKGDRRVDILYWAVPLNARHLSSQNPLVRWWSLRLVLKALVSLYYEGTSINGLGAFTSIVGRKGKGVDLAEILSQAGYKDLHITTGNVGTALLAAQEAVALQEKLWGKSDPIIGVLGATGSVGRPLVDFLQTHAPLARIRAFGRSLERLRQTFPVARANANLLLTTDLAELRVCDLVLVAVSSTEELNLAGVKAGAIVVDISRPRVVAQSLAKRPDILVIDGGLGTAPGNHVHGFDIGLPNGVLYGCTLETVVWAAAFAYYTVPHGNRSIGTYSALDLRELELLTTQMGFGLLPYPRYEEKVMNEESLNQFVKVAGALR